MLVCVQCIQVITTNTSAKLLHQQQVWFTITTIQVSIQPLFWWICEFLSLISVASLTSQYGDDRACEDRFLADLDFRVFQRVFATWCAILLFLAWMWYSLVRARIVLAGSPTYFPPQMYYFNEQTVASGGRFTITWCHPMVVVPKSNSSEPRITVDLTGLNKYVRRPAYPTRVPRDVVASIPGGMRYFTTFDSRHGYWQVPLDPESSALTTFLTPWGPF